jgi:pilus assembly protein CpaF
MSDVKRAKLVLETSLLSSLLKQPEVTDISFNGEHIFYQSSLSGRHQSPLMMTSEQAYQLIKHLTNLMNIPFSYLDAIVDMSVDRYRIFAVGPAISRKHYLASLTFAIRIQPESGVMKFYFLAEENPWRPMLIQLMTLGYSLVIAGKTGSGKTQLQKELISLMPPAQRLIIIDNILELDGLSVPHLDLTIWQVQQVDEMQKMIEGALRSNPDWLIVAEARGQEFKYVLQAAKTGHPIITTLHSDHLEGIYSRMVSMLSQENAHYVNAALKEEIKSVFPVLIQLRQRMEAGIINRTIDAIGLRIDQTWIKYENPINLDSLVTRKK